VPRLVASAESNNVEILDLAVAEPTLETVFINSTGKSCATHEHHTTFDVNPTRSVFDASRTAMGALILRDLVVVWKTKREFVLRT